VPLGQAATLLAGATLYPAPGEPDPTVGAPLVSMNVPFSAAPLYTGTLKSAVYKNDSSNPYGGLTFVYQVSNDLVSLDPIHHLTINTIGLRLAGAGCLRRGMVCLSTPTIEPAARRPLGLLMSDLITPGGAR
jgi:hypothetical protein